MLNKEISELEEEHTQYSNISNKIRSGILLNEKNANTEEYRNRNDNDILVEEQRLLLNEVIQSKKGIEKVVESKEKLMINVTQNIIYMDSKITSTIKTLSKYKNKINNEIDHDLIHSNLLKLNLLNKEDCK